MAPIPYENDRLEAVMWERFQSPRVSRCELWRHPGWELRCEVDGETRRTAVQRRRDTAEEQASDWLSASESRGWGTTAVSQD
jgi:hypothetical protein